MVTLVIQNLKLESPCQNGKQKIVNFKIAVKENALATNIIESWRERYNFGELAFKNYDYENRSIRIDKVIDGDLLLWLVFIRVRLLQSGNGFPRKTKSFPPTVLIN